MDDTILPAKKPTKKDRKKEIALQRRIWDEEWRQALATLTSIGYESDQVSEFLEGSGGPGVEETLRNTMRALNREKEALWATDRVVAELNKSHAMVRTTSTCVLTEREDPLNPGQMGFILETKNSFLSWYEHDIVIDEEGREKTKAQIWFKSPDKKRYPNGLALSPSKDLPGCYNLWRGFAVQKKKGCCKLFKDHIRDVICAGNDSSYTYVWKWLANLFQHPEVLSTALLLLGAPGSGKGTFVTAIGHLLGQHFTHVTDLNQILGKFNASMCKALLVFGDEAVWRKKEDAGILKGMISEKTMVVEFKHVDPIVMKSYRHFIFASNEDYALHIDRDDRRIFVLQVNDKHKDNQKYFEDIEKELSNGGYEALLYDLLEENLDGYYPNVLPKNNNAFSIKLLGAPSPHKYSYNALEIGSFDIGNGHPQTGWVTRISKTRVYKDYVCWCTNQSIRPEEIGQFWASLRKLFPGIKDVRSRVGTTREYCAEFPELNEAREQFAKAYKSGPEIWE